MHIRSEVSLAVFSAHPNLRDWERLDNRSTLGGDNWRSVTGIDEDYRIVLPSSTYPFALYGTSTLGKPTKGPGDSLSFTDILNGETVPAVTQYRVLPGASQWALFGVTSPAPIPDYVGPPIDTATDPALELGLHPPVRPDVTLHGNDATAFCETSTNAACAPVKQWMTDSQAAYTALANAITAYNNDFRSRAYSAWTAYQVDLQTTTPTVVASQPGQIVAGGNLTITGSAVLNDKSQIVAGGNNVINAPSFENRQPTAQQVVTGTGTATYSRPVSGGLTTGDKRSNAVSSYTAAPVSTTIDLPINAPTVQGSSPGKQAASTASSAQGAGTGAGPASFTLPNNALYRVVTTPGSPFLIETDPRFANYRTWLSGSSMLSQLNTDPAQVERFIGDGFYQQQLVQQQVIAATGLKYLGDYTDNETEYQALMSAGVTAARQFDLTVGTALSAAQVAQLTSDIVWMVNQTVTLPDGSTQTVLTPQVYLASGAAQQ